MKPWLETVVALVCLVGAGCRTDPNIVLLERENRELEDAIYELQACLDQYQHELEACRQANLALETKLAGESAGTQDSTRPQPTPDRAQPIPSPKGPALLPETPPPPSPRKPAPSPIQPDTLAPPKIELPGEPLPEGQVPETFRNPGTPDSAIPLPGSSAPGSAEIPGKSAQATPDNTRVAAVVLRPEKTGGHNADGRGGDDGLRAVIEPRDADGRPCLAAGPVSVVVLDPAIAGEAARVARWDFTAEEIAGLTSDDGIRLEMLWPQSPPVHDKLHLYVRYTTEDGRQLQADCPIDVTAGGRTDRWAPALLPPAVSETGQQPPAGQDKTAIRPAPRDAGQSGQLQAAAEPLPTVRRPAWSPHRR